MFTELEDIRSRGRLSVCLAIPARVVSVEGDVVTVDVRGRRTVVDARLVRARPDDYVLLSGGIAVRVLDREEAEEQLRFLAQLDGTVAP